MPSFCHRCGEEVFAAEEKRALNSSWHPGCFCCAACGKNLDSVGLEENRQLNNIYCTGCYRRLFATISYGQSRKSFSAMRMICGDSTSNRRSDNNDQANNPQTSSASGNGGFHASLGSSKYGPR